MAARDVLGLTQETGQLHPEEIRKAYHRALLSAHPDKASALSAPTKRPSLYTVDQIVEAYKTLLSELEDATFSYSVLDLDDFEFDESSQTYFHTCRCGHGYTVSDTDLEQGKSIIGCEGCSLLVKVTYQAVE